SRADDCGTLRDFPSTAPDRTSKVPFYTSGVAERLREAAMGELADRRATLDGARKVCRIETQCNERRRASTEPSAADPIGRRRFPLDCERVRSTSAMRTRIAGHWPPR